MVRAATLGMLGLAFGSVACRGLPVCDVVNPQFVMVERSGSETEGIAGKAEIQPTRAYETLHAGFKTVALRLPDNCYNASLHQAQNEDAAQLESTCGIPLQVLEATLTRGGYQVLSWSTLMGIEHQQNVPVHVAAQQLGADFVIIVNDMYVGMEQTGGAAEAKYRYFLSDTEGKRERPAELFKGDRVWLKDFVRGHAGGDVAARGGKALQARLNATVVLAKGLEPTPTPKAATPGAPPPPAPAPAAAPGAARSGEAIWFYNWRLGEEPKKYAGERFLFAGIPVSDYHRAFPKNPAIDDSDPHRHYWWPVAPAVQEAIPEPPRDTAESEESFTSKVEVTVEEKAKLYRQIADDFVRRFKGG